ncbi:ethylene-responsive transcription factor ERF020-like [Primulina tabacum]|uniref:ethylene-responsive transcription factor ERF020-like n=1 Tax=Primulina tabacum TaxID=48773 RepID=UPI003F599030
MSCSSSDDTKNGNCSSSATSQNKYKGIRRRKWGKWVSEIRVPGTSERLWLGSYTSAEAAAVAHDVALYCLRGNSAPIDNFNFPSMLPGSVRMGMSPAEVQKAASDAGLAIDARLSNSLKPQHDDENEIPQKQDQLVGGHDQVINWEPTNHENWGWSRRSAHDEDQHLNISVDDYLQWSNQ